MLKIIWFQIESDMKNLDMEGKEAQEQWRKKALEKV